MKEELPAYQHCFIYRSYKMQRCWQRCSVILLLPLILSFSLIACRNKTLPNQDMIDLLKISKGNDYSPDNIFCPEAKVKFCDSIIENASDNNTINGALSNKANALLQLGEEQKAIDIYQDLLGKIPPGNLDQKQSVL